MGRGGDNWGLRKGFWLGLSAVFLGAAYMNGFDAISGVLLVVVIALAYLTSREIFAGQDS